MRSDPVPFFRFMFLLALLTREEEKEEENKESVVRDI